MTLYEFAPTRSIRARWMLQELGVAFQAISVNLAAGEHRQAHFLAINPAGKVPALVDGDVVLTESVAIAIYLAEKYPERGFMPTNLRERAQAYRWMLFAVSELEQPLWRIARHTTLYRKAERLAGDVPIAQREFKEMAAVLERHLSGRTFVAGDRFGTADIVVAYTLDWGDTAGLLADFPQLRGYLQRMYARERAPRHIRDLLQALPNPASS